MGAKWLGQKAHPRRRRFTKPNQTPATGQRGRGPAAPTVNPRSVTDFEDVTSIPFVFARHPIYHEAHIHMNNIYSDAFMDMDDLFAVTAPPSRTTFVAHAVTTAIRSAPAPAVTVTAAAAPSTTRLRMLFNPASLPADVQTRFQHKQDKRILTTVIYTTFNCPGDPCHNMHYWIDPGLEKTICADCTIFFHIPIDKKMATKNPVPCKKDTHAAICRWYQTFQETLMQCGVYVHLLWLFRKNHGGEWVLLLETLQMMIS